MQELQDLKDFDDTRCTAYKRRINTAQRVSERSIQRHSTPTSQVRQHLIMPGVPPPPVLPKSGSVFSIHRETVKKITLQKVRGIMKKKTKKDMKKKKKKKKKKKRRRIPERKGGEEEDHEEEVQDAKAEEEGAEEEAEHEHEQEQEQEMKMKITRRRPRCR